MVITSFDMYIYFIRKSFAYPGIIYMKMVSALEIILNQKSKGRKKKKKKPT